MNGLFCELGEHSVMVGYVNYGENIRVQSVRIVKGKQIESNIMPYLRPSIIEGYEQEILEYLTEEGLLND